MASPPRGETSSHGINDNHPSEVWLWCCSVPTGPLKADGGQQRRSGPQRQVIHFPSSNCTRADATLLQTRMELLVWKLVQVPLQAQRGIFIAMVAQSCTVVTEIMSVPGLLHRNEHKALQMTQDAFAFGRPLAQVPSRRRPPWGQASEQIAEQEQVRSHCELPTPV